MLQRTSGWHSPQGKRGNGCRHARPCFCKDPQNASAYNNRGNAYNILEQYDRDVTAAFAQRYELRLQFDRAMDEMQAKQAAVRAAGGVSGGWWGSGYDELNNGIGAQLTEVERAITTLNRSTLSQLDRTMSPTALATLHRAYRRQAYPEAYRDPEAAEPRFHEAFGLDDLTEAQREELAEVLQDPVLSALFSDEGTA